MYFTIAVAPICRPGQETTYGVGRNEVVDVTCEIEANPSNLSFVWKFKNTSGTSTLSASRFTVEGTRSQAKFHPLTELDYGSLSCWARNELGTQLEPCVYHIIPAGIVYACVPHISRRSLARGLYIYIRSATSSRVVGAAYEGTAANNNDDDDDEYTFLL